MAAVLPAGTTEGANTGIEGALDYAREGITSVDEVLRLAEDLG